MFVPKFPRYVGVTAILLVILEFLIIMIGIAILVNPKLVDPTPKYLVALLVINTITATFAFAGAIQLNKFMFIPFFFSMAVLISIHIVVFVVRITGWGDWSDLVHVTVIVFNILMTYGVGVLYRHILKAERAVCLTSCLHGHRTYQAI